jgi:dephospho-CoA kinase
VIIDNDGSLDELEPQVERLWSELRARASEAGVPEDRS